MFLAFFWGGGGEEVGDVYQFWFIRSKESATIGTLAGGRTTHPLCFPLPKTPSEYSRVFLPSSPGN